MFWSITNIFKLIFINNQLISSIFLCFPNCWSLQVRNPLVFLQMFPIFPGILVSIESLFHVSENTDFFFQFFENVHILYIRIYNLYLIVTAFILISPILFTFQDWNKLFFSQRFKIFLKNLHKCRYFNCTHFYFINFSLFWREISPSPFCHPIRYLKSPMIIR